MLFLLQNQLEHKYFIVKTFLLRCFSGFEAEIYCLKSSTETENTSMTKRSLNNIKTET